MKHKYIKQVKEMTDKELRDERRRIVEVIVTRLKHDYRLDIINSELLRRKHLLLHRFGDLFEGD